MEIIKSLDLALKALKADKNRVVSDDDNRTNEIVMNLCENKKSRNLTHVSNIEAIGKSNFLTSNAKKIFNYLRLAFIKALIF